MITTLDKELENIVGKEYGGFSSREFSNLIKSYLQGKVTSEFKVPERGDGRTGRIDILYEVDGKRYGIEIDRISARRKSIVKLYSIYLDYRVVITRSPAKVIYI